MSALALFAASFVVVFALGFQQLNVTAGLYSLAFGTSILIGFSQLVLFKYLPGPTSAVDVTGYLLGNALGIVAAMKAHPALMSWRDRRDDVVRQAVEDLHAGVQLEQDERGAERRQLETDIALAAARCEVESFCQPFSMGMAMWFDTNNPTSGPGTEATVQASVDRAVRYLDLRDQVVRHPTVHALVRFRT